MKTCRARKVLATKRRGSSWPVVVETDNGRYLTKLSGAGHGVSALVAEVIVAALADRIGLRVPGRVLVALDAGVEREDRDAELAQLLDSSSGLNLGFEWVEGARDLRREDLVHVSRDEASAIAWLDWLVVNPDRTWRSPNLLLRKGALFLIDHGSALPFHYAWSAVTEDTPRRPLVDLSSHALDARATALEEWDALLADVLDRETLREAVREVPDTFLGALLPPSAGADAILRRREAYTAFLWKRLKPPRPFSQGILLDDRGTPRSRAVQ
jgi:hypothetical protein